MEILSNVGCALGRTWENFQPMDPFTLWRHNFKSPPDHLIFVAMDAPDGEAQDLFGPHA
jgi:hypothetical protein